MKCWICQNLFCLILIGLFNHPFFAQIQSSFPFGPITAENAIDLEKQAETRLFEWNRSAIESAHSTYLNAFAVWKKLGAPDKASAALRKAAKTAKILGNNKTAEDLYFQSLEISKNSKLNGEQINAFCELALLYLEEGSPAKAKQIFSQARRLAGPDESKFDDGLFWFTSAEFEYAGRNIKKSIEFYIKSAAAAESPDEKAIYLRFLGDAYLFEENYEQAQAKLRQSLEISNSIGDKRSQALSQVVLAHTLGKLNDKQAALDYYHQAENLFPDDIDLVEKARLMNAIGNIFKEFGELGLSIEYRKKALRLFDQANYAYGKAATLSSLGMLYTNTGDFEQAKIHLLESEASARKLNDRYYLAITHEELGNLTFFEGNYANAKSYYEQSLKYFLESDSKREIALIYAKLGQIFQLQNNFEASKTYFRRSLEINRKIQNKLEESENLYQIARLELTGNDPDKALKTIKESIGLTETFSFNVANAKLKSKYFSNVFERYRLYIKILMGMRKAAAGDAPIIEALQAAEKSRARILLENLSLAEADITKDADAETIEREREIRHLLNTKADKLTDLLSQNAEKSLTDKIGNEIAGLENELENLKAQLKQKSPIYSAIRNPAPFDVDDFRQNVLDDNSLLLEFSFGPEESYLWLVAKNAVEAYVLPPREEIETRVENLRELLHERELKPDESLDDFQKRIAAAETEYNAEALELSRLLFGQIADKLGRKRLIVVPDGELHYFPLAALPAPGSDDPFLLTNEIVYEPSAQTLAVLSKGRKQTAPADKNLLIFSDPIFTADDPRFSPENRPLETVPAETPRPQRFRYVESLGHLPRLTASKDESEIIVDFFGSSRVDNFSGFAATRENLVNLKTEKYRIIHFATHGLTNEERPELSGIVLSRFDEKGRKLDEFFRIQDIYGIDLNADLIVLSACKTGIGKEVKGEGLMSLNNAFLQSGAKTVMASFWKVEDGATLELMRQFYAALADEKLTPSESLRRAQIKLRENPDYRSPFFWAAFTVQGDFRNVPQISGGSGKWIYALALVPVALLGLYYFGRRRFYSTAKP